MCSFVSGVDCVVPSDYLGYYLSSSLNLTEPLQFMSTSQGPLVRVEGEGRGGACGDVLPVVTSRVWLLASTACPRTETQTLGVPVVRAGVNTWTGVVSAASGGALVTVEYAENATTRFPLTLSTIVQGSSGSASNMTLLFTAFSTTIPADAAALLVAPQNCTEVV